MKKLQIGSLLYHYYYGTLSVADIEDGYVAAEMENPRDDWPIPGTHYGAGIVTFPMAALNCWFFETEDKIGKEKPVPKLSQGQTPQAIEPDYMFTHSDFPERKAYLIKKLKKSAKADA